MPNLNIVTNFEVDVLIAIDQRIQKMVLVLIGVQKFCSEEQMMFGNAYIAGQNLG